MAVPLGATCNCSLCHIEVRLLADLTLAEDGVFQELLSVSNGLREFSSVSNLLLYLKTAPADTRSDELLRELFSARTIHPVYVESLLVLAFLPMLHGTIRRVAMHQPGLLAEDIAQQTLSVLLQFLLSDELRARQSHFAFAISRAVKRQVFEWANRECGQNGVMNHGNGELLSALTVEEPFERYALLRHFLHRCVTKGLLTDSELDLLIQFKLDGNNGEKLGETNGTSSNAVRQRLKRLLTKLRRLAQ
jgi:DNA-directed RNA polymerase specialized sigma24 family protein